MLSFGVTREGKALEIDCDQEGLELFIKTLEKLRSTSTHVHLRAPRDLSESNPWGKTAIPEVIISTGGD